MPRHLRLLSSYGITSYIQAGREVFSNATQGFLGDLTKLISGNRPPELRDPLTGQVAEPRFHEFNFRNSVRHGLKGQVQGARWVFLLSYVIRSYAERTITTGLPRGFTLATHATLPIHGKDGLVWGVLDAGLLEDIGG